MRRRIGILSICLLLASGGCGRPKMVSVYPVSGRVLYLDKPLVGALVICQFAEGDKPPEMQMWPNGTTDKEGNFKLSTYFTGDGAPVGKYVVTITCPVKLPDPNKEVSPPEDRKDRFEGRYSNPKTSTIAFEVKAGSNLLEPFRLN